tara:strand:+ start:807 stop:3101 length:2295 start_codon:yes stop_codon:yes gene_type:complete
MAEQQKTAAEERSEALSTLGVGGGILTGILARKPIFRAGQKVYKGIRGLMDSGKKATDDMIDVPEQSSITAPSSSIADDMAAYQSLTKQQAAAREAKDQDIQFVELAQKKVKEDPLTLAGRTKAVGADESVHGSALFDYIATFPGMGRKKGYVASADAWASYLKKPSQQKVGNIKLEITRDELFDTNIAKFDRDGNLVGGYLKLAKDENVPVSARTLLEMVARNPANNTAVKRLGSNTTPQLQPVVDDFIESYENVLARVMGHVRTTAGEDSRFFGTLQQEANDHFEMWMKFQTRHYGGFFEPNRDSDVAFKRIYKMNLKTLEDNKQALEETGFMFDDFFAPLKKKYEKMEKVLENNGKPLSANKYASYDNNFIYRQYGSETFDEDVVFFKTTDPEASIFGRGFRQPSSHYTQEAPNALYHVRYGRRSVRKSDELGASADQEKVYVIDELQSDVHQNMRKKLTESSPPFGGKVEDRINPTNANFLQSLFKDRRLEKFNEIEDLLSGARTEGRLTKEAQDKYKTLSAEFKTIDETQKKGMLGKSTLRDMEETYKNLSVDFMPLFSDTKGWGAHAIKYMVKRAANDGVDYIGISPAEMVSLKKAGRKIKNLRFYGNARGTAGYRNYKMKGQLTNPKQTAELPQIFKDLAKQYNSTAKTIKVSKSDPKKPFKVILEGDPFDAGEEIFTYSKTEHLGAFKTPREAENFRQMISNFDLRGREIKVVEMAADDPDLYYPVFSLKITPEMAKQPHKLYKSKGGLVVDIFKW